MYVLLRAHLSLKTERRYSTFLARRLARARRISLISIAMISQSLARRQEVIAHADCYNLRRRHPLPHLGGRIPQRRLSFPRVESSFARTQLHTLCGGTRIANASHRVAAVRKYIHARTLAPLINPIRSRITVIESNNAKRRQPAAPSVYIHFYSGAFE